jgi:glycosyltransferase involved in cell wall biosynthesis
MFNALDYPIAFARPLRTDTSPPSAWLGHLPFGMVSIALTQPRVVVELGTFTGVSYCGFCQAVEQLESGTRCFAIDSWEGDAHTGPLGVNALADLREHHDQRYGGFSTLTQCRFDEALAFFADGSIDLLHIDGYHTYDAARHDFEQWLPKLSERGVVLLHDIEVRSGDFGVWRLWSELQQVYPHFAFSHSYGLGILAIGATVPEPLQSFLSADHRETQRLRRYFFDLGQRLIEQVVHASRERTLIEEHQRLTRNLTAQIADMEHAVQQQAIRMTEQSHALVARDQLIAERESQLHHLQTLLAHADETHHHQIMAREEAEHALIAVQSQQQQMAHQLHLIDRRLSWQLVRAAWSLQLHLAPLDSPQGKIWLTISSATRRILGKPLLPDVHQRPSLGHAPKALPPPEPVGAEQEIVVEALPSLVEVVSSDTADNEQAPEPPLAPLLNEHEMYLEWVRRSAPLYNHAATSHQIAALTRRPLISIIVPIYNTEPEDLRAMLDSILAQHYPDWELCLADDASTAPHIQQILTAYVARDSRIKVSYTTQNGGIAIASNRAITLASGPYIALLDHDDVLTPDALYAVALALQDIDADIIYSDNDVMHQSGERFSPLYKPAWCPEFFLSIMYTCHFSVYRKALIDAVGGFSPGFDGGQDFEMVLRFLPQVRRVVHIPRILYSWRLAAGSAARSVEAKPYAYNAVRRALDEYLRRQSPSGDARFDRLIGFYHARREIPNPPKATIAIVARDNADQLRRCIASIEARTSYSPFKIMIVDGGSRDPEMLTYLEESEHQVVRDAEAYNFPMLCNAAAKAADGEYLVLLDSAAEILTPEWLSGLIEQGQLPTVGAVGAKILKSDGTIHHAGIILNSERIGSYSLQGHPAYESPEYLNSANLVRNYSAVSAACLLIRRELYLELGGMNSDDLALAFADIDLCLRLWQRGLSVVFSPYAVLRQDRSVLRDWDGRQVDIPDYHAAAWMRRNWQAALNDDPCYSPNLGREVDRLYRIDFAKPEGTHYLVSGPSGDTIIGPLTAGRVVQQAVAIEENGFCGISLRFATWERRCAGSVAFKLCDRGTTEPIYVETIDAATLVDNHYHPIIFAPRADSAGKSYRFSIEFTPAPGSPDLTLYASTETDTAIGPYRDNDRPQQGTLAFRAFALGPQFRIVADGVPLFAMP